METATLVHDLLDRAIGVAAAEMQRHEMRQKIRQGLVLPLVAMLYAEIYPYVIALGSCVFIILLLSLLTTLGMFLKPLRASP